VRSPKTQKRDVVIDAILEKKRWTGACYRRQWESHCVKTSLSRQLWQYARSSITVPCNRYGTGWWCGRVHYRGVITIELRTEF